MSGSSLKSLLSIGTVVADVYEPRVLDYFLVIMMEIGREVFDAVSICPLRL